MMLKSTETIAIEDVFPSRATLILRRFFTIYDIIYVSEGDDEGEFEDAQLLHHHGPSLDCFLELTST